MGEIQSTNRPHISIKWCTYPPFQQNWRDWWYMVFDVPPHNNREIPLYFLRKIYVEFALGKHIKYFDMLYFQGVGRGIPKNHSNARILYLNLLIPQPHTPLDRPNVPHAHQVIPEIERVLLSLAQAIVFHNNVVEHLDGLTCAKMCLALIPLDEVH